AGEAWWDLNNDDDYREEVDYGWVNDERWIDERNIEELLTPINIWPEDYR
ncbi:11621_t:CDS:1, partial [Scutellospora calospora]